MASVVKVGNRNVPVLGHVEFTGEPNSKGSWNAILSDIYNQGYTVEELARYGVLAADRFSTARGSTQHSDQITNSYIDGGRTGIGDGTELVVIITEGEGDYDNPQNKGVSCEAQLVRQEGQSSINIDGPWNGILASKYYSPTTLAQGDYTRLFAISFNYPGAAIEKDRRNGYVIGCGREHYKVTEPSTDPTYTIDTSALLWLNIPYFNHTRDYDLSYDEPVPGPDPFDPTEPEEYDPSGDDTSDLIPIPQDPNIGVTKAGFINVYKPSMNALQGLGDVLFPNVVTATDIVDAVLKLCMVISNQNLINYVIDCHVLPCTPVTGTSAEIKVGYIMTGINAPKVTSDYVNVSCGSINIPEFFGGFLDYGDNTVAKIYLPFIGFVDTKPEFFQSGTLSIDYKFNVIDGSFMAYIRSSSSKSNLAGSVIAQYAGNACMHFPITGANYSAMVSGIIGSAISPSSAGKGVSKALGKAYSAANTAAGGPQVQQSNGYNSTAAILGVRTPFLMIERPSVAYPSNYKHDKGYPTNITTLLSNVSGYTEIEDIDLSGIPLTQAEIEELRGLLKEGVYF